MKLESLGEVIAERRFTLHHNGRPPETVVVLLGKPQHIPNHTDFYCPYQIKGPSSERIMAICGLDAFQALQLALNTIGVELEVIQRDSGGELICESGDKGDLGFPIPDWKKE